MLLWSCGLWIRTGGLKPGKPRESAGKIRATASHHPPASNKPRPGRVDFVDTLASAPRLVPYRAPDCHTVHMACLCSYRTVVCHAVQDVRFQYFIVVIWAGRVNAEVVIILHK